MDLLLLSVPLVLEVPALRETQHDPQLLDIHEDQLLSRILCLQQDPADLKHFININSYSSNMITGGRWFTVQISRGLKIKVGSRDLGL